MYFRIFSYLFISPPQSNLSIAKPIKIIIKFIFKPISIFISGFCAYNESRSDSQLYAIHHRIIFPRVFAFFMFPNLIVVIVYIVLIENFGDNEFGWKRPLFDVLNHIR